MRIEDLQGTGQIIFVPTDDFPALTLKKFSSFFNKTYGLDIKILPPLLLPHSTYNPNRNQYIAEKILTEIQKSLPQSTTEFPIIPIIFTDRDMYIQKYDWEYAFSFRQKSMAVVSTARMDYGFLHLWTADQETQDARLRKMVTKNIGVLYYHLPFSDNCQSAMYGNVGGPQELDLMSNQL